MVVWWFCVCVRTRVWGSAMFEGWSLSHVCVCVRYVCVYVEGQAVLTVGSERECGGA